MSSVWSGQSSASDNDDIKEEEHITDAVHKFSLRSKSWTIAIIATGLIFISAGVVRSSYMLAKYTNNYHTERRVLKESSLFYLLEDLIKFLGSESLARAKYLVSDFNPENYITLTEAVTNYDYVSQLENFFNLK